MKNNFSLSTLAKMLLVAIFAIGGVNYAQADTWSEDAGDDTTATHVTTKVTTTTVRDGKKKSRSKTVKKTTKKKKAHYPSKSSIKKAFKKKSNVKRGVSDLLTKVESGITDGHYKSSVIYSICQSASSNAKSKKKNWDAPEKTAVLDFFAFIVRNNHSFAKKTQLSKKKLKKITPPNGKLVRGIA